MGTGTYNDALPYINPVRARAQFAGGENRSVYYDGGAAASATPGVIVPPSFFPENSYYESNNIPVTTAASSSLAITNIATLPAGDEYIITTLGLTSTYDRMLCLLLNERARELAGEYLRWQDLSRTKTLVARAKAFNPDAAPNHSGSSFTASNSPNISRWNTSEWSSADFGTKTSDAKPGILT